MVSHQFWIVAEIQMYQISIFDKCTKSILKQSRETPLSIPMSKYSSSWANLFLIPTEKYDPRKKYFVLWMYVIIGNV